MHTRDCWVFPDPILCATLLTHWCVSLTAAGPPSLCRSSTVRSPSFPYRSSMPSCPVWTEIPNTAMMTQQTCFEIYQECLSDFFFFFQKLKNRSVCEVKISRQKIIRDNWMNGMTQVLSPCDPNEEREQDRCWLACTAGMTNSIPMSHSMLIFSRCNETLKQAALKTETILYALFDLTCVVDWLLMHTDR